MSNDRIFFKICGAAEWDRALEVGFYDGSSDDLRDGFIHFSFAHQLELTARKFFAGREDLVLVSVDPSLVIGDLRYEPARSGDLFPHLHGPLDPGAAVRVEPLPWDGHAHRFP